MAVQHAPYPVVGVDGNRALLHNHFVALDRARDFGHYSLNIREIRGAAIALRSTYGDEYRLALVNGLSQLRGEHNTGTAVLCQQVAQVLLKDRHSPFQELV